MCHSIISGAAQYCKRRLCSGTCVTISGVVDVSSFCASFDQYSVHVSLLHRQWYYERLQHQSLGCLHHISSMLPCLQQGTPLERSCNAGGAAGRSQALSALIGAGLAASNASAEAAAGGASASASASAASAANAACSVAVRAASTRFRHASALFMKEQRMQRGVCRVSRGEVCQKKQELLFSRKMMHAPMHAR